MDWFVFMDTIFNRLYSLLGYPIALVTVLIYKCNIYAGFPLALDFFGKKPGI